MTISPTKIQEPLKLDAYDKKILWQLSLNSRIPQTKLAKKIGISKERLHYKIKRLTQNLIDPSIILNYHTLKIDSYIILLKNLEDSELQKIKTEAPAFVIAQTIGKYNYILYILTKDVKKFCEEFLPTQHLEIFPITASYPDNYNPFNLKVKHPEPIKKDLSIALDKKDYNLLYHLSKHPLASTLKLSEKTSLDPKTINSRIKKMQEANLIQKIRFALDVLKMGVTAYFLKLDIIPKNKQNILTAIRSNNYSGFVYETHTGFFLWYMPPSHKELFEFTKKLETVDKTIKIDAMQTADIIKIETVPKAVLEIFKKRSD